MGLTWIGVLAIVWLLVMCLIGYCRGLIKEVISLMFFVFSLGLVWAVNPYVSQFIQENTVIYERVQESSQKLVEKKIEETIKKSSGSQKEIQQEVVDQIPLPKVLKEQLKEDNTTDVYQYLDVKNFAEYVANYLARLVINGISFIVSIIVVNVTLKIIAAILNLVSKLPILKGVNRLAGGCLGGIKGLAILWIILLVLTLCYSTDYGKAGMQIVEQDTFLSFLYENNIFIKFFMNIFRG